MQFLYGAKNTGQINNTNNDELLCGRLQNSPKGTNQTQNALYYAQITAELTKQHRCMIEQ